MLLRKQGMFVDVSASRNSKPGGLLYMDPLMPPHCAISKRQAGTPSLLMANTTAYSRGAINFSRRGPKPADRWRTDSVALHTYRTDFDCINCLQYISVCVQSGFRGACVTFLSLVGRLINNHPVASSTTELLHTYMYSKLSGLEVDY